MKKFGAVALGALLMVGMLAGCGSSEPKSSDAGQQGGAKAKLVMATNATFPPYEYMEGETMVGIDVDIAQLIAQKLDMELEIKDMDFNGIIAAVQSGTADMGMAGMTVDEERLKSVDFTRSYAKGVQVVIVKEDSDIASLDDLSGKKIGVQEATTGDIYATDDYGEDAMKRYNKGADAMAALMNDTVDCVIIDNEPAKNFVKANAGTKILPTEYANEDYAIAVAKDNTELKDKIDKALEELIADGSVQKIIDKYIPAEEK